MTSDRGVGDLGDDVLGVDPVQRQDEASGLPRRRSRRTQAVSERGARTGNGFDRLSTADGGLPSAVGSGVLR
jgi:hypothetical protein